MSMTDQEIEEAVAHDIKIWEDSLREQGIDPYAEDADTKAFRTKLELLESRAEARVQAVRAEMIRLMLFLFTASALLTGFGAVARGR